MQQPYLSLEAEFHDAFWAADDDGSEVALMADFLARYPGRSLEIGCGSGRLLFPLVHMGFDVEGLELSEDMIRMAETTASSKGLKPSIHTGDMTSWTAGQRYEALLAPAFTFQLAADPAATLSHWRSMLEVGSGLYLTLFIPFAELEGEMEEHEWYPDHEAPLADGRTAKLDTRHEIDTETQVLRRWHRYYFADRPADFHESLQTLRWYLPEQIHDLLEAAGFGIRAAFVDFDPARPATPEEIGESDGILTILAEVREA